MSVMNREFGIYMPSSWLSYINITSFQDPGMGSDFGSGMGMYPRSEFNSIGVVIQPQKFFQRLISSLSQSN